MLKWMMYEVLLQYMNQTHLNIGKNVYILGTFLLTVNW